LSVPLNQHLHTPDMLLVPTNMELYPPKRAPALPGLFVFALTFHEVPSRQEAAATAAGTRIGSNSTHGVLLFVEFQLFTTAWSFGSPTVIQSSGPGHDSPRSRRTCGSDESALRPTLFGTRSIVHLIVHDGDLIPSTSCRCFPFPKLRNGPCMGEGKLRAGTVHDPCPC
jgi:hypothetical protein